MLTPNNLLPPPTPASFFFLASLLRRLPSLMVLRFSFYFLHRRLLLPLLRRRLPSLRRLYSGVFLPSPFCFLLRRRLPSLRRLYSGVFHHSPSFASSVSCSSVSLLLLFWMLKILPCVSRPPSTGPVRKRRSDLGDLRLCLDEMGPRGDAAHHAQKMLFCAWTCWALTRHVVECEQLWARVPVSTGDRQNPLRDPW